jgi:hypothetical protein
VSVFVIHVEVIFTDCLYGVFLMCISVFLLCVCVLIMPTVSVMVPYVCPMFNMRLESPELLLLFQIACIRSLYLVWNILSACPVYFSGQSRHLIGQMSLLFYLSVPG